MDLNFTEDEQAFQRDVRAFLDEHVSPATRRAQKMTPSVFAEPAIGQPFRKALYEKGWAAPSWPVEYGGTGWSPAQRYIFELECARAAAPVYTPLGLKMVGPVIFTFGSDAQKAFYLPRILNGEDYWCQGYSEPGSGSDLASLKTRAVRDGDEYVINGTKIWTTHAHHANRMFALVRTSDGPKKQEGISFVLIDMDTPGISVRPIMTIGGDHEVNQVFLDDVRVPVGNVVGEEGKGWTYGKFLLEFERGAGFTTARLREALNGTLLLLDETDEAERGDLLLRASEIEIDIDALEAMELKLLSSLRAGESPGSISSILKLRASELRQSLTRLGLDSLGPDAIVWEGRRPLYSLNNPSFLPEEKIAVLPAYLDGRAFTIFGGSSEIQRDLIARSVIGM